MLPVLAKLPVFRLILRLANILAGSYPEWTGRACMPPLSIIISMMVARSRQPRVRRLKPERLRAWFGVYEAPSTASLCSTTPPHWRLPSSFQLHLHGDLFMS
uniref:Secreted protein n=1 Tax=Oryzias melastigma TaxID=30732 RepID=A0A3B3CN46_ORYME